MTAAQAKEYFMLSLSSCSFSAVNPDFLIFNKTCQEEMISNTETETHSSALAATL